MKLLSPHRMAKLFFWTLLIHQTPSLFQHPQTIPQPGSANINITPNNPPLLIPQRRILLLRSNLMTLLGYRGPPAIGDRRIPTSILPK